MNPPDDSPAVMKRRGRPPGAKEPCSSTLTVAVPPSYYDRIARLAAKDGQPLSAFVRQLVVLQLRGRDDSSTD